MPCPPWLCCDDVDCCTHRSISDTPEVLWSKSIDEIGFPPPLCRNSVSAIATDGTNLYTANGNRVQKWDASGTLVWDVASFSGASVTALTASSSNVWASSNAATTASITRFAASDGSIDWTATTDSNALSDNFIFAIDNDGSSVFSSGSLLKFGSDYGCGMKVDSTGAIVGVFGWNATASMIGFESTYIAVGGDAVYLCGGIAPIQPCPPSNDQAITKWDKDTLAWIWSAGNGTVGPIALRGSSDLYVANTGALDGTCNLELWNASDAEPQWGIVVKGNAIIGGIVVPDRRLTIDAMTVADTGNFLWVLTAVSGDVGGLARYLQELRQYDLSGTLIAVHSPYAVGAYPTPQPSAPYGMIAATGSGVLAAGAPHRCDVEDEHEFTDYDDACTPEETCPDECGDCSIFGKAVVDDCECREGIGQGCISIESDTCPELSSDGEQEATLTRNPDILGDDDPDFGWRIVVEKTLCGHNATIVADIYFFCGDGWAAKVTITIDTVGTFVFEDFIVTPGCGPDGPQFNFAHVELPECLECGGPDQTIRVTLKGECTEMMGLMAMSAPSAPSARLMASIDGPAAADGLILHDMGGGEWMDEDGVLIFRDDLATIGEESGPVTILSRSPFLAIATVGLNEVYVTEEA